MGHIIEVTIYEPENIYLKNEFIGIRTEDYYISDCNYDNYKLIVDFRIVGKLKNKEDKATKIICDLLIKHGIYDFKIWNST